MTHYLKIRPQFFSDVKNGLKTFEIRKDDRGFAVGDQLALEEFDNDHYTGFHINAIVRYILRGAPGLEDGYCLMSIEVPTPESSGLMDPWTEERVKARRRRDLKRRADVDSCEQFIPSAGQCRVCTDLICSRDGRCAFYSPRKSKPGGEEDA